MADRELQDADSKPHFLVFFKDFIYLFIKDTESGRDTGRGRSRLLPAPMWTRSQDSGIMLGVDTQPLSHPGVSLHLIFILPLEVLFLDSSSICRLINE